MSSKNNDILAYVTVEGDQAGPILVGLIGEGIQGSRSPEMHMREADAQGLRLIYQLFDFEEMHRTADDLPAMLDAVELSGFSGVNITHPFKQQVMAYLDELSEEARQVGAINTVLFREGRRIGHNTDWSGFAEGFERQLGGAARDHVVQIGAGGAGAATATALLRMGCGDLTIVDTRADRASALAERLSGVFAGARLSVGVSVERALDDADGVVNATPIGMIGHPGMPIEAGLLHDGLWVADVVYFPLETELLRTARSIGCRTADGGGMAVFQAARAFELFTGLDADRERMVENFKAR